MPAKASEEESVRFLLLCLKHSDIKHLDFHKVASDFGIKPPAARMRLTRLRKSIDDTFLQNSSSSSGVKQTKRSVSDPVPGKKGKAADAQLPGSGGYPYPPQRMRPRGPLNRSAPGNVYGGKGRVNGAPGLHQIYGGYVPGSPTPDENIPIDPILRNLAIYRAIRSPYPPIHAYNEVEDAPNKAQPLTPASSTTAYASTHPAVHTPPASPPKTNKIKLSQQMKGPDPENKGKRPTEGFGLEGQMIVID
ncbi:hypothetical protein EX30DRAFT_371883 [Ascodesmis nigricans]|uniref:Myb-like DNA-binding domain-containing protein n=1 Tax=Ascodesmis nigricans TaxID=341454 RepID=A0A4S2MW72_9PEZI|nr:hypothetical protein EX30DRAFT_371883 [Ascodesmis nigricans]